LQVGKRALLRGGGAMGIAGLLALDPFDEGDPDVKTPGIPTPNMPGTGNAIREDTKREGLYPWETEITPAARALQEMIGGQGGGDIFGDIYGEEGDMLSSDLDTYGSLFDDQLPGEWADLSGGDIISPDRISAPRSLGPNTAGLMGRGKAFQMGEDLLDFQGLGSLSIPPDRIPDRGMAGLGAREEADRAYEDLLDFEKNAIPTGVTGYSAGWPGGEEIRDFDLPPYYRASGGIIGLRNGGINPDDPTAWDPESHWKNIPEGMEVQFGDLPSGPTLAEDREAGRTFWPWLGRNLKKAGREIMTNPMILGANPGLWAAALAMPENRAKLRHGAETFADWTLPGFDPSIPLDEQKARLEGYGKGPAELVPIGAEDTDTASEEVSEAPGAPGGGAPGGGAPESTLGLEPDAIGKYRLASLRDRMKWGQTETPQEKAVADWYRQQAETTRGRGLVELLKAGSAAAGAAATPGGIGGALRAGADAQFALADRAAELERVPLTAAASRSRYNTFDEQQNVLGDIYQALTSRGDVDTQVLGQLKGIQMQLDQAGRMTPENMMRFQEVLMGMWERDYIDKETLDDLVGKITGQAMVTAGIRPT